MLTTVCLVKIPFKPLFILPQCKLSPVNKLTTFWIALLPCKPLLILAQLPSKPLFVSLSYRLSPLVHFVFVSEHNGRMKGKDWGDRWALSGRGRQLCHKCHVLIHHMTSLVRSVQATDPPNMVYQCVITLDVCM